MSPKTRRNAGEDVPSVDNRHAQSTSWENPCSKRGDQRLIVLPGTGRAKMLNACASSNSTSV